MPLFEDSFPLPVSGVAVEEEERRFNGRRQFFSQIQIRQMDPPHRECVGTMRDLSRDGLYFVVRSEGYAIGARLRLILPRSGSEWICEVVRTERLPNGGQGVGVRILGFGT
jgi:PilZ domain